MEDFHHHPGTRKRRRETTQQAAANGGDNLRSEGISEEAADQTPKGSDDKKSDGRFKCEYGGCGKSYTRAEHLARHQLNHAPKEIFKCNYPRCSRSFVRQDLCTRHQERHASQGSRLRDMNSITTSSKPPSAAESDIGSSPTKQSSPHINATSPTSRHASTQAFATTMPPIHGSGDPASTDSMEFSDFRTLSTTALPVAEITTQSSLNSDIPYSFSQENALETSLARFDEPASVVSNTSPPGLGADFAAWLFNEPGNAFNNVFPMGVQTTLGLTNIWDGFGGGYDADIFAEPTISPVLPDFLQQSLTGQSENHSGIPTGSTLLSQHKRRQIITLMQERFNEGANFGESKDDVLSGDQDSDEHALSMHSMNLYIGSFWYHFHSQMPILHRPTFSADSTHDYLLLAVMVIGASCLDRIHGSAVTDAAARLASFIAWHLRWQIYMHADFQPPAKLWVFQALLLLEVYEKMNAKRALHERAHIHFATTLTLMRRGSSLVGKSSGTATPILSEQRYSSQLVSYGYSTNDVSSITPDAYWERWITAEATRRAAFAAFMLDATHATMFGHAAIMVVHEIRLPLPCDDALWSATSSAEVGRVEASLHANGIKPTTFLEGLKNLLNGQKVRTNFFGRMILMAGLLSVSWHMRQRDLQSSSLGVRQALGVPDGWRRPLTKAFDFWKVDFDETIAHMRSGTLGWQRGAGGVDEEAIAEALGTVLHHLSHMTMSIDISDCQIFAGSTRMLGRTVTPADQQSVKERVMNWASTRRARQGAFHAIQYIKKILIPEFALENLSNRSDEDLVRYLYNARDDPLFNRRWALYYASMVLWTYGFALEGPLRPFPIHVAFNVSDYTALTPQHIRTMFEDAKSYLEGPIGTARSPDELQRIYVGKNRVVGLIGLVRKSFDGSRWELLREGSERLGRAVDMLRG